MATISGALGACGWVVGLTSLLTLSHLADAQTPLQPNAVNRVAPGYAPANAPPYGTGTVYPGYPLYGRYPSTGYSSFSLGVAPSTGYSYLPDTAYGYSNYPSYSSIRRGAYHSYPGYGSYRAGGYGSAYPSLGRLPTTGVNIYSSYVGYPVIGFASAVPLGSPVYAPGTVPSAGAILPASGPLASESPSD